MILRYFLPLYLVAYVIAAFFFRSYVVWKKTGINPVVFKGSDSAHDFIGRVLGKIDWRDLIDHVFGLDDFGSSAHG
jgi:hypothetical protein